MYQRFAYFVCFRRLITLNASENTAKWSSLSFGSLKIHRFYVRTYRVAQKLALFLYALTFFAKY